MHQSSTHATQRLKLAIDSAILISGSLQLLQRRLSVTVPALDEQHVNTLIAIDGYSQVMARDLILLRDALQQEVEWFADFEHRLADHRFFRETPPLEPADASE